MDMSFLKKELQGEYKDTFERIELYSLTVAGMETTAIDERLMNILDSLLNAQKEEASVEKVVGSDIEKFCKNYFQYVDRKSYLLEATRRIYQVARWIFIWELLELIFALSDNKSVWEITSDITPYLVGLIIGGFIEILSAVLIRPRVYKAKKVNTTAYSFGILVVWILCIIGSVIFFVDTGIELPLLYLVLLVGGYCAVYIIVRSIVQYKKNGSLRKEKNPYKEAEKEYRNREWMKNYAEGAKKRYNRISKRRMRKHQEAMTPQEFMDKLHKEQKLNRKIEVIAHIVLAIILCTCIIDTARTGSLGDILFATVFMAIFYFLWSKFYRFILNTEYIDVLLDECEQKGITILEYGKEENEMSEEVEISEEAEISEGKL